MFEDLGGLSQALTNRVSCTLSESTFAGSISWHHMRDIRQAQREFFPESRGGNSGTLLFQNVIRHARIGSGNAIEDVIERNFSTFRIALFARVDELFGLT